MGSDGDGRWRRRKAVPFDAAVLVLLMLAPMFVLLFSFTNTNRVLAYGNPTEANSAARYSVVVVDSAQDLAALAVRYGTTVDRIKADNQASLPIKKGTALTIRENTAVNPLSRGDVGDLWYWPVTGQITSGYGPRSGGFHHGIDIAASEDEAVRAARDGVVRKAEWIEVYGLTVLVDHGSGVQTLYAHNSKLLVKPGDRVKAGSILALAGDTGNATGPHVHFEIRFKGQTQDPTLYLPYIQAVAKR